MRMERVRGLRSGEPFPVYRDLAQRLLAAHEADERDPTVAQVLATCAAYSYADVATVARMMARLGLEDCACVGINQVVDAMFIWSTAFLVQSRCGRLVILCYRGTEPTNATNWLTDADVAPGPVALPAAGGTQSCAVHGGFYRNERATRWDVARELDLAAEGRSLLDPEEKTEHPLQALYVTGHSLGGAMAVLFALTSPHERLRAIYTFGQPMAARRPLPTVAGELGRKLFRHVAPRDPVPALRALRSAVRSPAAIPQLPGFHCLGPRSFPDVMSAGP